MIRILLRSLAGSVVTLLLAGFCGAALVRFGPGFETDERDLDPRLSDATRAAIHKEYESERNLFVFYSHFLRRGIHGDFGTSRALNTPVNKLIWARAGLTARLIVSGLAIGWTAGLGLALVNVFSRRAFFPIVSEVASGLALSLPASVLALLIFLLNGPVPLVLGIATFPVVYRYAQGIFGESLAAPYVLAARSRGVPDRWILWRYVALPSLGPLLALAGVAITGAFGAAIPIEVICDLPGLGQLAWKAAVARDLPVLVTLTLVVTTLTLAGNGLANMVSTFAKPGAR